VLTDEELAGLVHLPNRDINAPLLDWERMESGGGTPGAKGQFAPRGDSASPHAQPPGPTSESQPASEESVGQAGGGEDD
jgi:hypothetical protein